MPSTASDMLRYYHGCLRQYLQNVQDYKSVRRSERTGETLTASGKVRSAVGKLKSSAKAVLDAVPGEGSADSITVEMIDTLHNDLATANREWRTQVGEATMHYYSKETNGRWLQVYEPAGGEDNEDNVQIYEVTKLIRDCLIYLENIKAVLPRAVLVALDGAGGAGASMHALLRQLDGLGRLHTAGVDRDKASAQLSQLRADVAREKKEKEAIGGHVCTQ